MHIPWLSNKFRLYIQKNWTASGSNLACNPRDCLAIRGYAESALWGGEPSGAGEQQRANPDAGGMLRGRHGAARAAQGSASRVCVLLARGHGSEWEGDSQAGGRRANILVDTGLACAAAPQLRSGSADTLARADTGPPRSRPDLLSYTGTTCSARCDNDASGTAITCDQRGPS